MPVKGTEKAPVIDIVAREDRFLRAAKDVLKRYTIARRPQLEEGLAVFDIEGGQRPYVVRIHPDWSARPACTCPDAAQRAKAQTGGYCKHIMAVLLQQDDLRHQLLELFL